MKVIEFQAEGFRRLKAVRIRPDGALVQITGANENGKSSVLDGLWALLKGRAVAGPEPIRRGAEKAVLAGKLGTERVQWEIVRTFQYTADGKDMTTTLQVTEVDADGGRRRITKSPQAVLDGFLGALSFDPLAFARAKPAEQFETLRAFVPGFDFEVNSARRKSAYEKRTDINRELDRAKGAAASIQLPPGPKPAPVDTAAILDELTRAGDEVLRIGRLRAHAADVRSQADRMFDEAEEMQAKARSLVEAGNRIMEALKNEPALPEPPDTAPLKARLGNAEATKAAIALHESYERHMACARLHEAHSAECTAAIEALDREREKAIAAAEMPVEGLTLGDGIVLYNGLPFVQASSSARLKVSAAVAMAGNPELRIIRTYDGGLLDAKSLGVLAAMSASRGFQCWIERVSDDGKTGFVIEDGEIAR